MCLGTLGTLSICSDFIERPDVRMYYTNMPTDKIGFIVNVDKNDIKYPLSINIGGETISNIGTFEKWIIFYSGFDSLSKKVIVVDNFYKDPDSIRKFAIENLSYSESNYHKGSRSNDRFILDGTKERLEKIIGSKIRNWNDDKYANGKFQYCTSKDPIVYHVDIQDFAAMVFLTPNSPEGTGTSFYRSKISKKSNFYGNEMHSQEYVDTFKGLSKEMNFYDKTQFELVDSVGCVYNRLVIFDSRSIHAATGYFGDSIENSRFFQLFFFDVE
jgi:hypothetical protein